MSQETRSETATTTSTGLADWQAGIVGGLVGGAAMGAMITMMMQPVIEVAIPALYALAPPPNGLAGWVVHMAHSAILGVVFAAVATGTGVGRGVGRSAVVGLVYGVVLWVVLAAVVMPLWLGAVGFAGAPPFPNFALPGSLPGHAVYGLLLGVVYAALR
ncbi:MULTISPECIES: hypothetical protein [Halococcus]|uniref:Histidine kinase n=1 Tax=Halococcus salifodinae DSM 8989 TaxID=1227456 RepID=M0NAU2_9EURY|nr:MULTISPECIES: hypothetical protein [Halococcus]EMA55077.1 hypothetical protein C450_03382 [Halococcus salifodinae DSM 8989]